MAKEIEFCEDLIKYLEKHGFHELMNVPIKYNDGFNATQVQFYPKEFKNIRELKPETPFVGFEIDDETDGFVRGWLSDKGVTTKKVYYDTYDELDSFFKRITESKKSVHKSMKESKTSSILDDEFYDLYEQGYIYDEDENGMNMSYGEYAAVSDDLWEILENELEYYRDFPSAYDAYNEIMDNTSDDAKMFMGVSDDDYFYFEMNEDENTYSFSGEVPTVLEKLFKKFLKETDFERV